MSVFLVTGGSGFIGSHLCERLLELGHKVINLDNFNDFYKPSIKRNNILVANANSNYELIEGDIRDKNILNKILDNNKIDIIVHLGALAGVRKSIINPIEYIDVDVGGTVNLLQACKDKNIKKFIFASSSSVYGLNGIPFREDDYIDTPVSPYAASKLSGELYCRTYNHLYKIPTICLRFFTVYGPRQRPEMAIHRFVNLIDNGQEIAIFGNGKSSRDYTYIDDIIDGIIGAINFECNFEIFNLGNSSPIVLNNLIDLIEQKLGKTAYKRYMRVQKGDVEHTHADINKAKNLLGYNPKVCIEEGIERFVKWYTLTP